MSAEPYNRDRHSLEVFACPSDYAPSHFFVRYNKSFVAPIYHSNLEDIERSTGISVLQLWGWTFDQLADQVGLARDAQDFGSYVADHREGTIPCAASRTSDVFRSAYLRVLGALSSANRIDDSALRDYSAIVCPLDFSFWDIGAVARPDWWPQAPPRKDGLQSPDDWVETSKLALRNIDGRELIYADGPAFSEKHELQAVHFSLVPFAYRVLGTRLPTAERIFNLLQRPTWSLDSLHPKQLSFFDAPLSEWVPDDHEGIHIGDLILLPLLARIHTANINCWQYWRGTNPLVFPAAYLAQEGVAATDITSWSLQREPQTLFSGFNWSSGPMGRLGFQFGACGQFATIDRVWLQALLDKNQLKLGFVLNHEYRIRKGEYGDREDSSFAKLLDFERLIIP
jgi:hypothetical protein